MHQHLTCCSVWGPSFVWPVAHCLTSINSFAAAHGAHPLSGLLPTVSLACPLPHWLQRVKPSGVDEMRWRQAMAAAGGPDNPDRSAEQTPSAMGGHLRVQRVAVQALAVRGAMHRCWCAPGTGRMCAAGGSCTHPRRGGCSREAHSMRAQCQLCWCGGLGLRAVS